MKIRYLALSFCIGVLLASCSTLPERASQPNIEPASQEQEWILDVINFAIVNWR
jgi:hypothetical protein